MCGGFKLSRTQRLYGFGICWLAGLVISLLSFLMFSTGNVAGFAVLYTFGNIVSLCGTGFLVGFLSQFKRMFDPTRLTSTIIFLGSMAATLIIAFTVSGAGGTILCLIFCGIQFLALLWYSLSYIPFARDMVKKCCPF